MGKFPSADLFQGQHLLQDRVGGGGPEGGRHLAPLGDGLHPHQQPLLTPQAPLNLTNSYNVLLRHRQ